MTVATGVPLNLLTAVAVEGSCESRDLHIAVALEGALKAE